MYQVEDMYYPRNYFVININYIMRNKDVKDDCIGSPQVLIFLAIWFFSCIFLEFKRTCSKEGWIFVVTLKCLFNVHLIFVSCSYSTLHSNW